MLNKISEGYTKPKMPNQQPFEDILRFYGYFIEKIHESAVEQERMRFLVVNYFIENNTIMIHEPR